MCVHTIENNGSGEKQQSAQTTRETRSDRVNRQASDALTEGVASSESNKRKEGARSDSG